MDRGLVQGLVGYGGHSIQSQLQGSPFDRLYDLRNLSEAADKQVLPLTDIPAFNDQEFTIALRAVDDSVTAATYMAEVGNDDSSGDRCMIQITASLEPQIRVRTAGVYLIDTNTSETLSDNVPFVVVAAFRKNGANVEAKILNGKDGGIVTASDVGSMPSVQHLGIARRCNTTSGEFTGDMQWLGVMNGYASNEKMRELAEFLENA